MKKFLTLSACLLVLTTLGACEKKLTGENLAKVTNGASTAEAEKILGKPTSVETTELPMLSTTKYGYQQGSDHVTLIFVNDKLISKTGSLGVVKGVPVEGSPEKSDKP